MSCTECRAAPAPRLELGSSSRCLSRLPGPRGSSARLWCLSAEKSLVNIRYRYALISRAERSTERELRERETESRESATDYLSPVVRRTLSFQTRNSISYHAYMCNL